MRYLETIDIEDSEKVRFYIETLLVKNDIEDEDIFYTLLEECVGYIHKNKLGKEKSKNLLEPFDKDKNMDNIMIMLCRDFVSDMESVKYLKNIFNDLGDIISMMILLFQKKNNMNYGIISENLLYCYDYKLDNEDIEEILNKLCEYEEFRNDPSCESIRCYLKSKRVFDKEKYQKPKWVNLIEGENISLLTSVPTGLSGLSDKDVKFKEILEGAKNFFYKIVPEETNVFLKDIPEEIENSLRIFLETSTNSQSLVLKLGNPNRVWGPENKMKDKECCSGPKGEGPCRMLQCECLEEFDEDDSYDPKLGMTWFTGKCDSCEKEILDPSHALRFPNEEGSWKGCYCSFDCLNLDPPYEKTKKSDILINLMRLVINYYGIMDRSSFC